MDYKGSVLYCLGKELRKNIIIQGVPRNIRAERRFESRLRYLIFFFETFSRQPLFTCMIFKNNKLERKNKYYSTFFTNLNIILIGQELVLFDPGIKNQNTVLYCLNCFCHNLIIENRKYFFNNNTLLKIQI